MPRWPILIALCLALPACQAVGGVSDAPCPSNNPCGDSDTDSRLIIPGQPKLARAVFELLPGCPSSLQVMARRIVYRAIRPDDEPGQSAAAPDDDSDCEGPEPGLLRASRPGRTLAAR